LDEVRERKKAMATLSLAFNIATGALEADQEALNIVSNNVANANTPGYTREIANWEQNDPLTIGGAIYGEGASVTGPVSQRSLVLNQSLQQQGQVASASSARLTALQQLESIFAPSTTANSSSSSDSTSGIDNDLSQFFSALSQLESNPADNSLRQGVITAADNLAADFNSTSMQLSQQQSSLDQQTSSVVTQVNALSSSIAQLNQQIESQSPNADAGTLEDQRQEDIQQLSQLIGIHQIQTENNGLTITTSSGAVLVSESQAYSLSTAPSGGVTHIYDSQGNDITSSLASGGGQIGGILTARDQDIPQVESALDTLAYDFGTAVNQANEAGADANGNTGTAIFNLPGSTAGAAAGISVAITDPSLIAAAATGKGSSDDTNLLTMAGLQNQDIVGGTTASGYYSGLVSSLGSLVSEVTTQNTAQESSVSQLQTQVNSLSAVDLNEEASSLETFEQSYEAASKLFSVVDEVMVAALNLGVQEQFSS
jgi:flagellar hook-associated protein 1